MSADDSPAREQSTLWCRAYARASTWWRDLRQCSCGAGCITATWPCGINQESFVPVISNGNNCDTELLGFIDQINWRSHPGAAEQHVRIDAAHAKGAGAPDGLPASARNACGNRSLTLRAEISSSSSSSSSREGQKKKFRKIDQMYISYQSMAVTGLDTPLQKLRQ